MLKRLLLVCILAMLCVLSGWADVPETLQCNSSLLGIFEGSSVLTAIWNPNKYKCESGTYLNAQDATCKVCPDGSYCPGYTEPEGFAYNGEDQGIQYCGNDNDGWISGNGASAQSECYKIASTTCAQYNPYAVEHGMTIYENSESFGCKQYFGSETCVPDEPVVCNVASVTCDEGYTQEIGEGDKVICVAGTKECMAGTYLSVGATECSVCPEDSYCPGKVYVLADNTELQGVNVCASGLSSPAGARSENDCGRVLHMHKDKRTEHSLIVKVDGVKYYADATPVLSVVAPITINANTEKTLRITIDGIDYFVHETIYSE